MTPYDIAHLTTILLTDEASKDEETIERCTATVLQCVAEAERQGMEWPKSLREKLEAGFRKAEQRLGDPIKGHDAGRLAGPVSKAIKVGGAVRLL